MQAIERGEGSGGDWQEYRMRLAQAASDAQTFEAALEQAVGARQVQQPNSKSSLTQVSIFKV